MSCNIQKKTLDHFKKKGLIEDNRLVPTEKIDDFQAENDKLTQYAKEIKNVDLGPLFDLKMTTVERSGNQGTRFINRAIPNTKAFEAIQKYNDNNISFEKKLESLNNSKPEVKSFIYNPKKISKRNVNKNQDEKLNDSNEITNILFNGSTQNLTANEFLRHVLSSPELEINDSAKALFKKLLPTRAKIKFVAKEALLNNDDTYAQYDSLTRQISLNRDILSTGNVYYALESIIHEIIHDMTVRALEAPKNNFQRDFRNNIINALNYYKSKTSNSDLYGFSNEAEFIAEIMTNSEFRNELKNIDKGSFFNKIINFIKSLFGLNNDVSNVKEITKSIVEIIEKESQNYKSPLQKGYIYQKDVSEKSKKNDASPNLQKKLNDIKTVIDKILSSIEAVKRKSTSSKGYNKKTQEKFNKIQTLLNDLYKKSSKKAILEYLNIANSELSSLMNSLDNSYDQDKLTIDYIHRSRQYATVFNYMDDISNIIENLRFSNEIDSNEYNEITNMLDQVTSRYKRYRIRSLNLSKNLLAKKFASFNTKPITRAKEKYSKEYTDIKLTTMSKEEYIDSKINENIEEIQQQQYDEIREQLDIIPLDISSYNTLLETEKNIDNLALHLASLSFDLADSKIREASINIRNTFANAVKEFQPKGSTNQKKYKNLIDFKNGEYYLISKYKSDFIIKFNELKNKIKETEEEFGINSKEHKKAKINYSKWRKENTKVTYKTINGIKVIDSHIPLDKYINPKYNKLTTKEKNFLNALKDSAIRADKKTNSINSLIYNPLGGELKNNEVIFIKFPSIRITDTELVLSGKIKTLAKDKLGDLIKKREDDTEYGELTDEQLDNTIKVMSTMDGQTRNAVPIYFRNTINAEEQSLDLPTIFLLNEAMATNFEQKSMIEADMLILKDIVRESKVKQVELVSGFKKIAAIFGYNKKESTQIEKDGVDSNIYKKLSSVIENRLYNISQVSVGKIKGIDINALANSIGKYTADLTLGLNYLSAMPNALQAKIQNFIEGVGKGTFERKDLRFAEAEYWKQMTNGGLNDIGALTNQNKINLLIEKFNLMGDFNAVKNLMEDNSKFRALMKRGTLHSLNSMAEHYGQSTLMLAILNSIKVKNNKGNYIDSKGNIVSKEEAMTLYEAFDIKNVNGNNTLVLNPLAEQTSFSFSNLKDLGMIEHQNLLKKKIIDLQGQYDNTIQSHMQRYWYGKLIFMFRKWMLSSYKRRWSGIQHYNKEWNNLTEEQRYYDYSLQEYQEGTYTSFARFLKFGVLEAIKNLKLEIITSNWNELSDKEKSNIHKTSRELLLISMAIISTMLTQALAEDDEENEKLYYTLAYVFRRQQSELMQYFNPMESIRVLRTPFASLNVIEKTGDVLYQILPHNITDEYKTGDNKGRLKAWVKFKKLIPYIAQSERNAEKSLNFLQSIY